MIVERLISMQSCAFLIFATNCCVPPVVWLTLAGVTATDATGAGAGAAVLPVATFERPPNTAFTLSVPRNAIDRKSTRLNSSHTVISYAVFCLKKKTHY